MKDNRYKEPSGFWYGLIRALSRLLSFIACRRVVLRNELRDVSGPCVVISNHQMDFDFINLICATRRKMSFVASKAIISTLPIPSADEKMGLITKLQFQTEPNDIKRMKSVLDSGGILVIYPSGLMSKDGTETPVPEATYRFLRWLNADIYAAKNYGTYFLMPRWTRKLRTGKTYIDIYKLFSREELKAVSSEELRRRTDEVLCFDAYREQERFKVEYSGGDNLEGIEDMLYVCPNCGTEFSMQVRGHSTICCSSCGYEESADRMGFLHNKKGIGREIRYVSDWNRWIIDRLREEIRAIPGYRLSLETKLEKLINGRYTEVGAGTVSVSAQGVELDGDDRGEPLSIRANAKAFPALPFIPGRYVDIQSKGEVYRCRLKDGRYASKFNNAVMIFNKQEV